jgi:hypothetical protein
VGFQNSATDADLDLYAARSYSLMRPPRMGRRLIRLYRTPDRHLRAPSAAPGGRVLRSTCLYRWLETGSSQT